MERVLEGYDGKITLAAARYNAGFTQESAAKKIGVSKNTLNNWENGKNMPSWEMVKKIEETYRWPSDMLNFLPRKLA